MVLIFADTVLASVAKLAAAVLTCAAVGVFDDAFVLPLVDELVAAFAVASVLTSSSTVLGWFSVSVSTAAAGIVSEAPDAPVVEEEPTKEDTALDRIWIGYDRESPAKASAESV